MAETVRTKSDLLALMPVNTVGDISSQDIRDFVESTMGSKTVTTVNATTYSLLSNDNILHVTYSSTGECTITIPTDQIVDGREFTIKDAGFNASIKNITIETEASELIDGKES